MSRPGVDFSQGATGSVVQAPAVAYATDHLPDSAQGGDASDPASTSGNTTASSGASCVPEPYSAPPVEDQTFDPYDQTTSNVFRYRQQASVNLGSWFVHEKWMTPSVFKCAAGAQASELDIASGWGSVAGAQAVLERHWDTFITESDFNYLASIGINTVRLPIGYWTLGPNFTAGTAFEDVGQAYANSWPRVLRAINQAAHANIGVLLDLHGAVGSQNGQPHSGISDGQTQLFAIPENMDKTIAALEYVAGQLQSVNNVVGIQILNEPTYGTGLEDFYTRTIEALRATGPNAEDMPLYMHDGFQSDKFSPFIANRTDFVVQDHHSYFVFTPADQAESATQHTNDVNNTISPALLNTSKQDRRNLIVGEWSCALSPQSVESDGDATQVRKQFCTKQMQAYEADAAGWSFWSYMKEDCDNDPGWCFKAAVGKSLPHDFYTLRKSAAKDASLNATDVSDSDNLIMPTISKDILNLIGRPRPQAMAPLPNLAHRFAAIRARRDADPTSSGHAAAVNASTSRGYTDGMTTAKVFADKESRLGFTGQFILDAIKVAGPEQIPQSTQHAYRDGFLQGLKEGERVAKES
ncbi:glycoside hydrolase family 5 protein [Hypholoma sublateritium FD-334 SS-4]|uniref:Glycoside hydrolase family 5 protein n=1 Tax=Hypholoma sublateritium (strain FD-334 SS-4) TaxID=945553 RepID=A0A0D2NN87_HYPSF|nr:glycoside hydrolase family 5 protein [Hypholoma sublateritium FD-334 SS-4]